jgi:arylformamidase
MGEFNWRTATDADVECQYSPSQFSQRPLEEYLREYAQSSAEAGDPRELRHTGGPLLIYIHGGYWQQLSAADSLFNASDARRHNVSLAAVEYTLAPRASIDQIISECVDHVQRLIDECAPSRVVLAGCSAGAHLVACCVHHARLHGQIDAAVFLSGIFDLRPLVRTSTNDALRLDEQTAERLSPMFFRFEDLPRCLVAVGTHETSEFIRQSREFAQVLSVERALVVPHRDHFDLPYDLLSENSEVGDWVLRHLRED